ncbi:MAG: bifunctional phosphoribosylaminoimidazolecarboxamide formyltransferase/IMP cyclohydrolase [Clostridia bacterium]
MKRRALLSVSDKVGIVEFARELVRLNYEIVSTGGTAKILLEAGIEVLAIDQVTGFPEILDGRVKTLHPKVHGGILALRNEEHLNILKEMEIKTIDLVVVNLYPFKETVANPLAKHEDIIENIDIGGPSMVRSAAKNYQYVTVIVNPKDYQKVLAEIKVTGDTKITTREWLAYKAFSHTAAYDMMISAYFAKRLETNAMPTYQFIAGEKVADLRYGENPHQKAACYITNDHGLANAKQYQGKELSYNNLMDADAAWKLVQEFSEPICAIIKHTNPCGVAVAENIELAFDKAYAADEISAFGGIIAVNAIVEENLAEKICGIFFEVIIATGYSQKALEIFKNKPNMRLLELAGKKSAEKESLIRQIQGGFLLQEEDIVYEDSNEWDWVTKEKHQGVNHDLILAWKIAKHVKSNAIVLVKDSATIGIGPGQTNRIGAAKIALEQAGEKASGAILASDAFFPFDDTVRIAAKAGVKTIIQPGGSKNDFLSITACDELGISMAFTGVRHFKH